MTSTEKLPGAALARSLPLLICPLCAQSLMLQGGSFMCIANHSFDIAREGYVNLLTGRPVNGDTREMLQARRRFLDQGYYQPLSEAINVLVLAQLEARGIERPQLLDAGCGEGYYLAALERELVRSGRDSLALGLDSSKDAIRMAAKRYHAPAFVVADLNRRLIVADQALDVLLNIFAPRNPGEFARVLAPDGLLLVVIPAPDHLRQLRASLQLLEIEADKQERVVARLGEFFRLVDRRSLAYEMTLEGVGLQECVMMTPNYWHLAEEERAALQEQGELTTQVEFVCLAFERLSERTVEG